MAIGYTSSPLRGASYTSSHARLAQRAVGGWLAISVTRAGVRVVRTVAGAGALIAIQTMGSLSMSRGPINEEWSSKPLDGAIVGGACSWPLPHHNCKEIHQYRVCIPKTNRLNRCTLFDRAIRTS